MSVGLILLGLLTSAVVVMIIAIIFDLLGIKV
jgi:hypothetical protein